MESIRKIGVTGESNTYYLTVPKAMIRKLKWRKGQKKVVKLAKDKIVIQDWVKK